MGTICLHPQVGKPSNAAGGKVNGVRVNLTTLFNILYNLEFGWLVMKLAISLDCMLGWLFLWLYALSPFCDKGTLSLCACLFFKGLVIHSYIIKSDLLKVGVQLQEC